MGVTGVARTTQPAHIFMPTEKQLQKVYGSLADKAAKNHTLKKLSKPPAGADKARGIDISRGELGVGKQVFDIKGTLYLKTQVVAPNTKPSWFKIGPAPLF